jgi:hypothetical protein
MCSWRQAKIRGHVRAVLGEVTCPPIFPTGFSIQTRESISLIRLLPFSCGFTWPRRYEGRNYDRMGGNQVRNIR